MIRTTLGDSPTQGKTTYFKKKEEKKKTRSHNLCEDIVDKPIGSN